MEIRVIVNPQAAAGAAASKSEAVLRLLESGGATAKLAETARPGHATELAREAIRDGVSALLVVGGDGSLNEVAQAYLGPTGDPVPGPELGLIPAGTGGDFSRTVKLPSELPAAVDRILNGVASGVDLGVVEAIGEDGQKVTRAFLNIASFGLSGLVARLANQGGKWMGGKLAFYVATTRATLGYSNAPVLLSVDGKEVHRGKINAVAFANGQYFGGGMKVAPNADLSDGKLDCVVLGDLGRVAVMANTPLLYKGDHLKLDKVTQYRGSTFHAEPWLTDADVFVEVDGETPGKLPMSVRVHPGAIQFRC